MGTAGPARPSPRRDAGWWPKRRAGPTGNTFPRMTFTLTWPHRSCLSIAGLPVRRGRMSGMSAAVPVHRGQRQEGSTGADPSQGYRSSTATPCDTIRVRKYTPRGCTKLWQTVTRSMSSPVKRTPLCPSTRCSTNQTPQTRGSQYTWSTWLAPATVTATGTWDFRNYLQAGFT